MKQPSDMIQAMGLGPVWVRRDAFRPEAEPVADAAPHSASMQQKRSTDVDLAAHASLAPAQRAAAIGRMQWPELIEAIKGCTACRLCQSRTQAVPGVGDPGAAWLIVGEAPGAEEDRRGEPFVGRAGQLLDQMLSALGLKRSDNVYIANVLKCRPPNNRDPEADEIGACRGYLQRQIELIQPKVIFCVGRFAANTLLGRDERVGALRGHIHDYQGVPLIVSYHPAYLLRNPADKAKVWRDLLMAKRALSGT